MRQKSINLNLTFSFYDLFLDEDVYTLLLYVKVYTKESIICCVLKTRNEDIKITTAMLKWFSNYTVLKALLNRKVRR